MSYMYRLVVNCHLASCAIDIVELKASIKALFSTRPIGRYATVQRRLNDGTLGGAWEDASGMNMRVCSVDMPFCRDTIYVIDGVVCVGYRAAEKHIMEMGYTLEEFKELIISNVL